MSSSTEPRPIDCDHGRRREAIVEELLREVVQGRLVSGQHLVTRALAERFGVSHTPIREALIALKGIGVVDLLPNRGAVVRKVATKDVREICDVRRALECEAVRAACGRIDLDLLSTLRVELQSLLSTGDPSNPDRVIQARRVDSRLHDAVASACGNTFLAKELERLKILFRAFRDVSWEYVERRRDYYRLDEEAREYLAIVEALRTENRPEAIRAMSRHILSGRNYWCRSVPNPQAGRSEDQRPIARLEGRQPV